MLFLLCCLTKARSTCCACLYLTTFNCIKMSQNYLTTNLLVESLTINLDSYGPGPKDIDTFTLGQLEKMMQKVEQFLTNGKLIPFEGDELERDKIMACFVQQPNAVVCRYCMESLHEYETVTQHIQMHDDEKEMQCIPKETAANGCETLPTDHDNEKSEVPHHEKEPKEIKVKPYVNYMKKHCIPRLNIQLNKKMRKFLQQDIDTLVEQAFSESEQVKVAVENEEVLQELEECLKPHYPKVKCYLFGSRFVGTGSALSDLDIFVDLQEVYYGRNGRSDVDDVTKSVEKVETILRETKQWTIDEIILNCRVPLLRVISHKVDVVCDLTFTNGLAHRNSLWLNYMFSLQPNSRLLVCYLKKWCREKIVNGYTISLLVIYFFQLMEVLPSVASLQSDSAHDVIIDGWNAGFATPTLEELNLPPETSSMASLATMFFQLYSFNNFYSSFWSLEAEVISPFNGACWGDPLLKDMFDSPNCCRVPPNMERLKQYMLQHQNDTNLRNKFAYNKPLVVQDPFDLSHNVAKSIPLDVAARLVRSFELSAKLLLQSANSRAMPDD